MTAAAVAAQADEANPTSTLLSELNPVSSTLLSSGQSIQLGDLFDPSGEQDLTFAFSIADESIMTGVVEYVTLVIPGDFDLDGDVDGADFLVLQQGLGTIYDATDLADWEMNYGMGVGPLSASTAVPEPSTLLLGALACIAFCRRAD